MTSLFSHFYVFCSNISWNSPQLLSIYHSLTHSLTHPPTHSLTHPPTHSLIGPIVPQFFFRTTVNYTRNTLGASACEYHLSPAAWDLIMYLSGYYPVTCLVWECLPEAEAFISIALWVVGSHKPHRQYKPENFEGNKNMFKM